MTETTAPKTNRVLAWVAMCAIALTALAVPVMAETKPAEALAWSPTVTLNGKVGCTYSARNTVTWVWISASNGEAGWAWLGGGSMTRPYSFTFNRAPTSTMNVTVKWGCSIDGQHQTTFGVNRPASGTTTTRNICYWSPCWI